MRVIVWVLVSLFALIVMSGIVVTVVVERESSYQLETLGGDGPTRALVLYHPSRDAHFSEEISLAFAEGLKDAGLLVDRATMTKQTPTRPHGYALVAVVSNTFWSTPDLPTLRYLKRSDLSGLPAVGLICGSGSTARSQQILGATLSNAGATMLGTRSFWIMRPNDEARMSEPNRAVAQDMARNFGSEIGAKIGREANTRGT
jgi:hypothetical protein